MSPFYFLHKNYVLKESFFLLLFFYNHRKALFQYMICFFSHYQLTQFIQFLKFGLIGSLGFVCDVSVVFLLRSLLGLNAAIFIAYFVAATSNWFLNRIWTFQNASHQRPFMQWTRFLSANSLGFFLNRTTVYLLIFFVPFCFHFPPLALACGAFVGLFANFFISRIVVFETDSISQHSSPQKKVK